MRSRSARTPREKAMRYRGLARLAAFTAAMASIAITAKLFASPARGTALLSIDRVTDDQANEVTDAGSAVEAVAAAFPTARVESVTPWEQPADIRWFNGRPVRPVKTITFLVTAYSPDARSCGTSADGITASGYSVWTNGFKSVAADPRILPLGSLVSVPGYDDGNVVPVLDTGGKIKGNRLDLLYPTHEVAKQWGAQRLKVVIWEYADGKPNGFKTAHRH